MDLGSIGASAVKEEYGAPLVKILSGAEYEFYSKNVTAGQRHDIVKNMRGLLGPRALAFLRLISEPDGDQE